MNDENISEALMLINTLRSLFNCQNSRDEEDILHLINAIKWRIDKIHSENLDKHQEYKAR